MEYLKMILSALGGGMVVAVATVLFVKNKIEKLIDKKIDYHFDTKLENEKGIVEQNIC
jgi:site-specific recombinase